MDTMMATEERKKVTMLLPKPLWRRLRVVAAAEDKTLTDLLKEWLERDLSERDAGGERFTLRRSQ